MFKKEEEKQKQDCGPSSLQTVFLVVASLLASIQPHGLWLLWPLPQHADLYRQEPRPPDVEDKRKASNMSVLCNLSKMPVSVCFLAI